MTSLSTRKSRLLWAGAFSLVDTSNGAVMSVCQMLRQLIAQGYEVAILGATIFDHQRGSTRLKPHWAIIEEKSADVIYFEDGPLLHRTVVTASTSRDQMTSHETDLWFAQYQAALDGFKPDAVYFYGGNTLELLIASEARARGIPTIFYLANGSYQGERWCRDVNLLLTNSRATAAMYAQTQGYVVTPVGAFIDPSGVMAKQHSRKRILFVNPTVEKGVGIVIMLALLLEQRRPDIVFEVVEARGEWAGMLRHISRGLGSERNSLSNVVVTEHTDDMRPVYGRARLLLAPSLWWETFGRVAIEAMINGIPVIASKRGGLPEAIGDAGFTLTLPPQCYEAPYSYLPTAAGLESLIEKIILRLYDDEAFYADYVGRARRMAQTQHSLQASTQRLLQAIEPLMSQRAGDCDGHAALQALHKQGLPA